MTDRNDGGPAFPQHDLSGYGMGPAECNNGGMTLRDWFAGQIVGALISCPEDDFQIFVEEHGTGSVTRLSYAIADKMLEARK